MLRSEHGGAAILARLLGAVRDVAGGTSTPMPICATG